MIIARVLVKSSNFFLPSFFPPPPPPLTGNFPFAARSMFLGCATNVSRAFHWIGYWQRLKRGIERSNKWQAPACSFIFNRTVHLIPTRRVEMYAPRYLALPDFSLPPLHSFQPLLKFSRLIATYVATGFPSEIRSIRVGFAVNPLLSVLIETNKRRIETTLDFRNPKFELKTFGPREKNNKFTIRSRVNKTREWWQGGSLWSEQKRNKLDYNSCFLFFFFSSRFPGMDTPEYLFRDNRGKVGDDIVTVSRTPTAPWSRLVDLAHL